MITVAVTTYNRRDIVGRAIRSALQFVARMSGRVVVVDDGSTDGTARLIAEEFSQALSSGTLRLVAHDANLGVTAAKNTSFAEAAPGWVLFLDSDDELLPEAAPKVARLLREQDRRVLAFFRCVDERGAFVGHRFDGPQELSLQRFTSHTSYGEALVAINKTIAPALPYDADLRGYEGVGCARLIKSHGPALLTDVVARRYDRSRQDRLSNIGSVLGRADLLAHGHLRYISICGSEIGVRSRAMLRIKASVYFLVSRLFATNWSRNG